MCRVEKFIEPLPPRNGSQPIYYEVDMNGCFNCKSHRLDRDGYGRIDRGGREWLMHRYIYSIVRQVIIPPGMVIMHQCDNPCCLNPNHLKLGTQAENMLHKKERNRPIKIGHKLTETEAEKLGQSDLTIKELALVFDVSHSTVVKKKAKNRIKNERKRAGDKPAVPNKSKTKERKSSHK